MTSDSAVDAATSTAVVSSDSQAVVKPKARTSHLTYLDGVRGLAAVYVVLYHASVPTWAGGPLPGKMQTFIKFLTYGHFSVAVFIVLSGYCLMMPVAQSSDFSLRGGFVSYIKRRARRILPPYYAALAICLALIAVVPILHHPSNTQWDGALPAFTVPAIGSHLLLIHNLSPGWIWKIDGPLWSVATEWQIYFAFPILILIARKWGLLAAVLIGIIVGEAPHFAHITAVELAAPWYLGLFAMGMAAATINFGSADSHTRLRSAIPWTTVTAILWVVTGIVAHKLTKLWWANLWASDLVMGLSTACLLVWLTEGAKESDAALRGTVRGWLLRIFQSRVAVGIGAFSYSLYLMHDPILVIVWSFLTWASPVMRIVLMLTVAMPIAFAVTYAFHLVFEKPFMKKAEPRKPKTAAVTG
jgi:peptidoglycan/LPS O-acetylase OafA/YrhL